jgi:hypothetical protein
MSFTVTDSNLFTLTNTVVRASTLVEDTTLSVMVDPYSLHLDVLNLGGTVVFDADWPVVAPITTRIVQDALGVFHVDVGDQTPNVETNAQSELLLSWSMQLYITSPMEYSLQKIKIITAHAASFIPEFRSLIDKSHKLVDTANDCFLGYTDSQLFTYIEGGLGIINSYQPSVIFSVDNFPLDQKQLLLDAGLIIGATSQQLFAIDSDIPNYNDNGATFTISHQPQLASFLNQITQRLDKLIPMMKLMYLNSGCIHTQMGPNMRLNALLTAAPSGSLFRNLFFVP